MGFRQTLHSGTERLPPQSTVSSASEPASEPRSSIPLVLSASLLLGKSPRSQGRARERNERHPYFLKYHHSKMRMMPEMRLDVPVRAT